VIEHPDDALLDPRAEFERLLAPCVCDWCGKAHVVRNAEEGVDRLVIIKPEWRCREVKQGGYVSKHWKAWRVCSLCLSKGQFDKWIFPVIAHMPENDFLAQLVQVQPMNLPAAQVMYMDIVVLRAYAERPLNLALYGRAQIDL